MATSTYKGKTIIIEENNDNEKLTINGTEIPVVKKDGKYEVYYQGGFDSLIKAAQAFIDTQ